MSVIGEKPLVKNNNFFISQYCPDKSFMNSDQCIDVRKFFYLCGENEEAVEEYMKFHY